MKRSERERDWTWLSLPDPSKEEWKTHPGNGIDLNGIEARIVWSDAYGDIAWIPVRRDEEELADQIAAQIVRTHNARLQARTRPMKEAQRPVDILRRLLTEADARGNDKLARILCEAMAEYFREEKAARDQAEAKAGMKGAA